MCERVRRHVLGVVLFVVFAALTWAAVGIAIVVSPDPQVIPATPTMPTTRTPTQSATRTPTATLAASSYRITYYGEVFRGGPLWCEEYGSYNPDDPTTVAVAVGTDLPCGTRLELCTVAGATSGKCVEVVVKDRCGGCGERHLDVSAAAWELLGQPDSVLVRVLPTATPAQAQSGSAEAPTGGKLTLPVGVTVRYDGCSESYGCSINTNYYDAGSHEVVLQGADEPYRKVVHEYLHAHQHWTINGGATLAPSAYDLAGWYGTAEGVAFMAAVGVPDPWPWPTESYATGIEAFATSGSLWYTDVSRLRVDCPVCYSWWEGSGL